MIKFRIDFLAPRSVLIWASPEGVLTKGALTHSVRHFSLENHLCTPSLQRFPSETYLHSRCPELLQCWEHVRLQFVAFCKMTFCRMNNIAKRHSAAFLSRFLTFLSRFVAKLTFASLITMWPAELHSTGMHFVGMKPALWHLQRVKQNRSWINSLKKTMPPRNTKRNSK